MTSSSSSLWKDLIAGGIAGTAGVVIGHPFDTIKVRLQQQQIQPPTIKTKIFPTISTPSSLSSSLSSSSSSMLRGKYAAPQHVIPHSNNLYRGLYRGIGAPLVTAALINASVFCVYGSASRMWDNHHSNSNDKNSSVSSNTTTTATTTTTTITKHAVCGLITGMITSLLLCPVEHVKIRLQTLQQQGSSSASSSSLPRSVSSFDVAKKLLLYSSDHGHGGGLQGIYRGLFVTCLRQGPSLAIYFPVYHLLKDVFVGNHGNINNDNNDNNNNKNGNDRKDPSSSSSSASSALWWSSALAGGLAGSFAWTIVYPIDVIKSRIQSLPMDTPSKKRSFYYIARNIHRNEGGLMKMILSRGLAVTILRAFPVNGTIFFVYENVNQWLLLNNNNFDNNNSNNIAAENYNREATDIVGDQEYSGVRTTHTNRNRNHNIPRRRSTLRVLDVDVKQKPTELTN